MLDLYRREIAACDAVPGRLSLDAPPARWPDYFSGWRFRDVREIILHVITETAVHAGHLYAARELLDGRYPAGPGGHADPARLSGPRPVPDRAQKEDGIFRKVRSLRTGRRA